MRQTSFCNSPSHFKAEGGAALVELALVVPFIIVIVFGSLEFTRILKVYHLASSLSREGANLGYRQCLIKDDPNSQQSVQQCLNERVPTNKVISLRQFAAQLTPNARVIVSAYRLERHNNIDYLAKVALTPDGAVTVNSPPAGTINFDQDASRGTSSSNVYDHKSKFALLGPCITVSDRRGPNRSVCQNLDGPPGLATTVTSLAKRQKIVFIGEAYVPHSPLVRGIAQFFDQHNSRYDAVIL